VATIIKFTGSELWVKVEQSNEEVLEAMSRAQGQPFLLDLADGGQVFVNPANIACWQTVVDRISPGRLESH
jgi:hypothetical protein